MVTTFQLQEPAPRVLLASAVALLVHYCDIAEGDAWTEVLNLAAYTPPTWIRIAVIEALYQGRYKVISVKQILDMWRRRGKILTHFNHEFEAIVTVPLPDRIQSQLRELAREHQQASRKQRHLQAVPEPLARPESPESKISGDRLSAETEASAPEAIVPDFPTPIPLDAPSPAASVPDEMKLDPIPTDAVPEFPTPLPLRSEVMTGSPRFRGNPKRIDQFCPLADSSEFDRKLLALANQA